MKKSVRKRREQRRGIKLELIKTGRRSPGREQFNMSAKRGRLERRTRKMIRKLCAGYLNSFCTFAALKQKKKNDEKKLRRCQMKMKKECARASTKAFFLVLEEFA